MRKALTTTALIAILVIFALPSSVLASSGYEPQQDDVVIFGQDYTLASGQTIAGSLVVFGGDVIVEAGASIQKDLVVFGGSVNMDGNLNGDIFALGGDIVLGPNAFVFGDVVSQGGNIISDPSARIQGDQFSNTAPFFSRGFNFGWGSWAFGSVVWLLFQSLAMSGVAVLVALFAPDHLRRTSETVLHRPFESGGLGCLTVILLPFVLIISILTLIGPIVIGFLAVVALALGWVALGYEIGRRVAQSFNQKWTIILEAWVGTLILGVVVSLIGIVPCVGWIVGVVLGAIGLGAVLLSRFGTFNNPSIAGSPKPAVRTSQSGSKTKK